MDYLIKPLLEIGEYNEALSCIKNYKAPINIVGPADSQKAHIAFSLCNCAGVKGIFITFNEMQARKMYEDLSFFLGDSVVFFPSKEIMLHDIAAKSNDAIYQRVKALERIILGDYSFVVTSAEAVVQKLIPPQLFKESVIRFTLGGRLDILDLTRRLVAMGYERMPIVEGRGQFAIRGGIIDIFSIDDENAVRIELFDDEIDSIRHFDILSQRSIDKLESVKVVPAREVIYNAEGRDTILQKIRSDLSEVLKNAKKKDPDYVKHLKSKIESDIETIKTHYYFAGIDRYIPYIIDSPCDIIDYTGDVVIFADEPARIKQRIENVLLENSETCKSMLEKGNLLPGSFELFFDFEALNGKLDKSKTVWLSTMLSSSQSKARVRNISILSKQMSSYQGHFDLLIDDVKVWKERKSSIIVLSGTRGRGERLCDTLCSKGLEATYIEDVNKKVLPGQVVVTRGSLNKGFEYPSIGLVVVSDKEVFGQDRRLKKSGTKKDGKKIKAFTDLSVGDYVVHEAHGIGLYVGIQQLVVDSIKKDYLKIKYQEGDFLYIPTNQLDLLQKYIGAEGKAPKLNRLGGSDWNKTKKRVKESLKELAGELIKLYAQRQSVKGFQYSKDTVWQKQFEEIFPYEETDDQLRCIEEVKADMETERPMDRLLCGDVGYGKTEVAIRAIFKAVMDGKQVAYLCPTTILSQQHYNNFKERMKDFPMRVDVVSRFRTKAEQKRILKDVKSGVIDVLVGTHRLLQKDIEFKNLGLLIVDEEQRFGVAHKERIKNMKPDIDVLTLTATPIPRTLHMSLVGIRDISVLEDPPEERYPVQTYVMEHNPDVVRDAIVREIGRGGQVFYLYNRVRTINIKASELQALVPDAKIITAHGQMDETQLEDIMLKFIDGEYNVLVCTTIIESGLDMPNVNTIIVEDADKMGLTQLYQLRGRVGRSNKLAYAYITYKKDKILNEVAEKRLQAIKEFTEFGSGFKIAMRDLEIRGAGNLLGAEQHGHMESVGYDMYCKLLAEAVRELQGESVAGENIEATIDINVNAYIDNSYIGSENQKIEMYKKIASIQDEQDAMDVEDELVDRYGDLPIAVRNLIQAAHLKVLAKACGFTTIQEKNDSVILQYREGMSVKLEVLGRLMEKYRRKLLFTASNTPYITFKTAGIIRDKLLENIKILLQDIKKLQNT